MRCSIRLSSPMSSPARSRSPSSTYDGQTAATPFRTASVPLCTGSLSCKLALASMCAFLLQPAPSACDRHTRVRRAPAPLAACAVAARARCGRERVRRRRRCKPADADTPWLARGGAALLRPPRRGCAHWHCCHKVSPPSRVIAARAAPPRMPRRHVRSVCVCHACCVRAHERAYLQCACARAAAIVCLCTTGTQHSAGEDRLLCAPDAALPACTARRLPHTCGTCDLRHVVPVRSRMRRRTEPVESQATHNRKVSQSEELSNFGCSRSQRDGSKHAPRDSSCDFNSAASWGVLV